MAIAPSLRGLLVTIVLVLWLFTSAGHTAESLTVDADHQYDYARSRLDAGAFDEAIAEFNRFIFFFPGDPRVSRVRFQTGMAHFGADRYEAAADIFASQTVNYTGSDLNDEAYFMLSRSHTRQGMLEQAMVDLHNLIAVSARAAVIDRARYELGWLHVDRGHWYAADQAFSRITAANQDRLQVADLKQTLALSDTIPVKRPTLAGWLSIVPGGGQLYCHRYQDALTAFLLNAGLIWAAFEAFDNDLYALGGVITFVEVGFYTGNIYGAVSSAHKYNRDRVRDFSEHLYRQRQPRQPMFSLVPVPDGAALRLSIGF